jgi:hypothetical protein
VIDLKRPLWWAFRGKVTANWAAINNRPYKTLMVGWLLPISWAAAAVFMEPGINHEQDKDNDADDDKEEDTWAGVP